MSTHIQIGDIAPRIRYAADGATAAFTYPFPIFQDTDLEVYVDETLQTLTTHYAVSGAGQSAGGSVTFVTAPSNGTTVTLVRRLAIQRISDFQASGEFRAKVINDELDFQTAALQQVEDDQSRSLRLSRFDDAASLELPAEASRASKVLAFDGNGDVALSNLTLSEIETGAAGPQGPAGPTGPAGNDGADGLFSGAEAAVTPALGDLMALKDVSDSGNPKFATVQDVLAAADGLADLGALVDVAADKLLVIDQTDGVPKTINPEDIGGGTMELISTTDLAGVTHAEHTSLDHTRYGMFFLEMLAVRPSAICHVQLQFSQDNGATWVQSDYTQGLYRLVCGTSADTPSGHENHSACYLSYDVNTGTNGLNGWAYIGAMNDAVARPYAMGQSYHVNSAQGVWNSIRFHGHPDNWDCDAFRVITSTGSFTSGTLRLYGIRK